MNDTIITFAGWTGGDVELTRTPTGATVASLRVGSTPRRFRDGAWEDLETIWYSVKAWRQLADNVAASIRRGQPVLVTGRLVAETWQRPDGTTATRHVVVASSIGHDLARGRTEFSRPAVEPAAAAPLPAAAAAPEPQPAGGVADEAA